MYTINSILPFDLMIDTDMGLIKHIQFRFQGDDKYYPGIMNCLNPDLTGFLQTALIHRKFANPLSAIMKPEKMIVSNPDEMLKSFFSESYTDILNLSGATGIFDMVCRSFFVADTLKYTILCKTEQESEFLKEKFRKRFRTDKVPCSVIVGTSGSVDIKNFDTIYVKDVHDIDKYFEKKRPPEGKNIIVAKYDFNKEFVPEKDEYLEIPLIEVCDKYSASNTISFIDVYPRFIEDKVVG